MMDIVVYNSIIILHLEYTHIKSFTRHSSECLLTLSHSEGTMVGCLQILGWSTPSGMSHSCNTCNWSDQKSPGLPAGNW